MKIARDLEICTDVAQFESKQVKFAQRMFEIRPVSPQFGQTLSPSSQINGLLLIPSDIAIDFRCHKIQGPSPERKCIYSQTNDLLTVILLFSVNSVHKWKWIEILFSDTSDHGGHSELLRRHHCTKQTGFKFQPFRM